MALPYDLHLQERAESVVQLLTEGQEGYWPVIAHADLRLGREPTWVECADSIIDRLGEVDFVTTTPFVRRHRHKSALVAETNVCRADIDPPKDLSELERQVFLDEAICRIQVNLGDPSWVIDSGRGLWAWFKLSDVVSIERAERLSKGIAQLAGSVDQGSWSCAQFTRLPSSRNEKTGRVSRVLTFSGERANPNRLEQALSDCLPVERPVRSQDRSAVVAVRADELSLRPEYREYAAGEWTREEAAEHFGRSRSEIEQSILTSLARQGLSAAELHEFAHASGLSKYVDAGVSYQDTSIRKAIELVQATPWEASPFRVSYKRNVPQDPKKTTRPVTKQDRLLPLRVLQAVDGEKLATELLESLAAELRVKPRTVRRHIKRHQQDGLVEPTTRGVPLRRTPMGELAAGKKFLSGGMRRRDTQRRKALGRHSVRPHDRPPRRPPGPTTQSMVLADVRRDARDLKRHNYDGRYRISFFENRKRVHYLQLLTPQDEIVTAHLREQLRIGWQPPFNGIGLPVFANFASVPGDSADQVAEAFDRFDLVPPGNLRVFAIGMLVDESTGWQPRFATEPDANGELRPLAGLIVEGVQFWDKVLDTGDWNGAVLRVKRTGEHRAKQFEIDLIDQALDATPHDLPNLQEYMQEIGDPDRTRRLVGALEPNWRFT